MPADIRKALERLWPAVEKAMRGLVFTADRAGEVAADMEAVRAALAAAPVPPADTVPLQGGLDNAALRAAWDRKLPGVEPTDRDLSAFALGAEFGFAACRALMNAGASLAVARVHRGGTDVFGRATILKEWLPGAESLPDGDHVLYAAPQPPASGSAAAPPKEPI